MKLINLSNLPFQPVSHDPQLQKKVMLKNGEVPHLTNYSQTQIPVGGTVSSHQHSDMWEVFLVVAGEGTITIQGKAFELNQGICVVVGPLEEHSLENTGTTELVLTYFGVA